MNEVTMSAGAIAKILLAVLSRSCFASKTEPRAQEPKHRQKGGEKREGTGGVIQGGSVTYMKKGRNKDAVNGAQKGVKASKEETRVEWTAGMEGATQG